MERGPIGPFRGYVRVLETQPAKFLRSGRYRVTAEWWDPGATSDSLEDVKGEGIAVAIMDAVCDQLAAGSSPDFDLAVQEAIAW